MRNAALIAVPVIIPRAVVAWGLSRLVFAALPLAIGEQFGSIPPSPIGIVVLAGAVGLADVHIRKEQILWANLGLTPTVLSALYAAAAIPGECLLALVLR